MKLYIAGRWDRRAELAVFANELDSRGHEITALWLRAGDEEYEGRWADYAERDMAGIYEAEMFILFTEHNPPKRNSRLVELGLAIAYGKEIVIIGPTETIFCTQADMQFTNKEDCLVWLKESGG